MKQISILTIIFLTIISMLSGQNFGINGTQWHYSEHAGGACPGNCEYLQLKSVTDTIISGQATHKITQTYFKHTGDTTNYDPIYLYESSDTVFMWSFSKSKFLITYIFNKNIGDTLTLDSPYQLGADTTYRLVIDTIISVTLDGIPLKKYGTTALDAFQYHNGGYFMDRIGGLDWFFPRQSIFPEAGGPIRCYSDIQIDTNFQNIDCDFILTTSINDLENKNNIKIYPNPTTNIVSIISKQRIEKIDICDMTGRLLATSKELTIDITDLTNGQYILSIHLKTGQVIEKKLIKIIP